eukprot:1399722-Rhodomonas_salina.2
MEEGGRAANTVSDFRFRTCSGLHAEECRGECGFSRAVLFGRRKVAGVCVVWSTDDDKLCRPQPAPA